MLTNEVALRKLSEALEDSLASEMTLASSESMLRSFSHSSSHPPNITVMLLLSAGATEFCREIEYNNRCCVVNEKTFILLRKALLIGKLLSKQSIS